MMMSWLGTAKGLPCARRQDVVHRQHERFGFNLGFNREGHMNGHLIGRRNRR